MKGFTLIERMVVVGVVAILALLTLRPAVVEEDAPIVPVAWICGFASVPDKMTVKGANRTDVPKDYLPARCR